MQLLKSLYFSAQSLTRWSPRPFPLESCNISPSWKLGLCSEAQGRSLRPRWIQGQWDRVSSPAWQSAERGELCRLSCLLSQMLSPPSLATKHSFYQFLPLSLISFLETLPVFPPRFSPCREKAVRGGSGLKDQNGSFLSPLGASRPPYGPQSLGIHLSDSDPALGHVTIVGLDPEATR